MAKKDPPKKIKAVDLAKYKAEGYKFKGPGEGGKEYYVQPKASPPRYFPPSGGGKPPSTKHKDPKGNEAFLIKQLQSGVPPEDLVKEGHASELGIEPLKGYYKENLVYTEPEPTTVSPIPLTKGLNVERKFMDELKPIDIGGGKFAKPVSYPDPNAGYSKETVKWFVDDKEIETPMLSSTYPNPNKIDDFSTGTLVPRYKENSFINKGANIGTVKPHASYVTPSALGQGINAVDAAVPTRVLGGQDVRNVGAGLDITREDYLPNEKNEAVPAEREKLPRLAFGKGGIVGKVRGYKGGGETAVGGFFNDAGNWLGNELVREADTVFSVFGAGDVMDKHYTKDETGSNAAKVGKITGGVAETLAPMAASQYGGPAAGAAVSSMQSGVKNEVEASGKHDAYGVDAYRAARIKAIEEQEKKAQLAKQFDENTNRSMNERQSYLGGANYKKGGIVEKIGCYNHGGIIKGKGGPTSDSIPAMVKGGSFIVPAKNADVAEMIAKKVLKVPSAKKKANLNQDGGEKVKLSDGEFMFTPAQKNKIINELGEEVLEALAPEAEETNSYAKGTPKKGVPKYKMPTDEEMDTIAPKQELTQLERLKLEDEASNAAMLNKSAMDYQKTNPTLPADKSSNKLTPAQTTSLISEGSSLINSIRGNQFSRNQIKKANKFLAESGKRPVGSIDQGFQDNLNRATAEAKYGLSAQELAALNNENVGLRNQEIDAARNFSGGSAANAYAMTRSAINDSFGRGLKTSIADRQAKLAKQAQADNLTAQKADMNRQLFEDTMAGWQQNQKSGAALLSSGLENQIGGQRYSEAMRQLAINRANEQGFLNSFQ